MQMNRSGFFLICTLYLGRDITLGKSVLGCAFFSFCLRPPLINPNLELKKNPTVSTYFYFIVKKQAKQNRKQSLIKSTLSEQK